MRAVAGRLEMRYRYSAQIVYNNFPWPEGSHGTKGTEETEGTNDKGTAATRAVPSLTSFGSLSSLSAAISQTAQAILDARAKYPCATLADLYDELTMPPALRRAHQENDRAVMAAYGFTTKMTESECVAELFNRYQALVEAD